MVPAPTSHTRHFANLLVEPDSLARPLVALIFVAIASDTSLAIDAFFLHCPRSVSKSHAIFDFSFLLDAF
jgi:hypothetical protein